MQAICGNLISVSNAAWSWITAFCGSSINMARYQVVKSNTFISSNSWSAGSYFKSHFNLLCAQDSLPGRTVFFYTQKRVAYKINIARVQLIAVRVVFSSFPAPPSFIKISLSCKSPSFFVLSKTLPALIDYYFHPRRVFAGRENFNLVGCFLRALLPLSTHWPAAFELNFL